jgi:DeoR/GlpR family transcriptional regulator of sugar metabolism
MFAKQRQAAFPDQVRRAGGICVGELVSSLGVSDVTIPACDTTQTS